MNRIFFLLLMMFPSIVSAQAFDVKTKKGTVKFTYDGGTVGTLGDVTAVINFDISDLSKGSVSGSVDVSTIDTENNLRNKHLKGKNFFDAENYPTMTFESTSISEEEKGFKIKGILKIKSTEKEVTFLAYKRGNELTLVSYIYGLDFDVAVGKKREKTGIEIVVKIPM